VRSGSATAASPLILGWFGEVVTVENCIQVPLTPPALKGVFNLRGEPVPLVSLPIVLQLQLIEHNHGTTRTAIVIRAKEMLAALIADRMEPVLTDVRERITPAANGENETCFGFLELPRGGSRTIVSVLDSTALIRRLASLSYLQPRES
jgi:chemotaxis signal transduction protein